MRPTREHATNNGQTYMVTSATWERRSLFQNESWARLLIGTIYHYRGSAYLLHAFVIMPDHIHVLLTPRTSLEKSVQFIKGGFSYRVKKELGSNMEVWQKGFSDHRIRDAEDYSRHVDYILKNPVRKDLCQRGEDFPYSSAARSFELNPVPRGLKPILEGDARGAPEGAPFQGKDRDGASEAAHFQGMHRDFAHERATFPNGDLGDAAERVHVPRGDLGDGPEAAPFQNKPVASVTLHNKSGKIAS